MPAQGFLVRRVTQEPAPCKRMCSGVAFLGVRRRGCSPDPKSGNSLRLLQGSARAASSLTSGLAVVPGEVGVDAVVSGRGCPMWWRAAPPDTNHARARPAGPQVWSRGGGCPGCGARYASRGCPCSPSHGIRNHPRLGTRMKHPMRCGEGASPPRDCPGRNPDSFAGQRFSACTTMTGHHAWVSTV